MYELGFWQSYVDEPNLLQWYDLPEELHNDLLQHQPDFGLGWMSESDWKRAHRTAIAYANASVARYDNAHHNAEHFRQTEERGLEAVRMLEAMKRWPVAGIEVKRAFAIALRLHDCHHCGSTFRVDSRNELYKPELGTAISQEWVSAEAANRLSSQLGFNAPSRLFMTMVIWASTFGGQAPKGAELGIPNVQPEGLWGRIMRAADVYPTSSALGTMRQMIAVNYCEVPAFAVPVDWNGMVESQLGFFRYIEFCYQQLDEICEVDLTEALGWRENLRILTHQVAELYDRPNTLFVRQVEAELYRSGITVA